ncbi:unnamed protein product [Rotaria magnacalcarata]|uniref:ABC transporter domain-containing protein n=1 Tax=Rotaria magnacalcarata TaxID=392030 RepID=A0A816USH1_9BILA|nr:unnamed protein product [Rotaria magnacalcarata]
MIMLCLIPLVIGSSFAFSKLTDNETVYELKSYAEAGQIVQEAFSSLRTVISFNGAKFEQKRYDKELGPTSWGGIRQGALFGLSEARGAAALVFRLIDEGKDESINEEEVWEDNTEFICNINSDIEFHNFNFHYPSRKDAPVLRNLSVIAHAGQTTALVGSRGCGKSTCISLFLRYYEPSSGELTIDGKPITDYNVQHLRENIGVVSQEPVLLGMTVYENIRFGKSNATQDEIEEAAREANAHNFIMQLPDKYETLGGERGVQLSGGEKQCIALARALLAIEIIHNMRTIKQLSVEKEVLRQYSGLFYEAIRLYRMTMIPISLAGGMCWTLDVYTMTFVYWRALDDFHGDIKFVGVKFISPTRPTSVVLNKFQLNIMPKGQRVTLVGGSGCGKSTTIQLLQRFYGVKKGQILLDGVDIRALNIHWVHSQFGLVSQEPI